MRAEPIANEEAGSGLSAKDWAPARAEALGREMGGTSGRHSSWGVHPSRGTGTREPAVLPGASFEVCGKQRSESSR